MLDSRKAASERIGVLSSKNNFRLAARLSRMQQNLASSKQRSLHLLG